MWERFKDLALGAERRRNYRQAGLHWLQALEQTSSFEKQDKRLLLTLQSLAKALGKQRKFQEAEPYVRRILETRMEVFGLGSLQVADTSFELAELLHQQIRYLQCEPLLTNAIEIYQKQLEPEHEQLLKALALMADVHEALGRYLEAEALLEQILKTHFLLRGEDDPTIKEVIESYSRVLEMTGNESKRETFKQKPAKHRSNQRKLNN
jgi:tetratricopeptide (TPR) repeat protein